MTMALVNLPPRFQDALLKPLLYPSNSLLRTINTYPKSLEKAGVSLDEIESDLFEDRKTEWEIPIRDLSTASGKGGLSVLLKKSRLIKLDVDKRNIHSHDKLLEWLGLSSQPGNMKKDPKCRFICLYGTHSRAKLKLTRVMLANILTFHQVMPAFLEFISVFGQQSEPSDLNFSGFRQQVLLINPPHDMVLPALGRSGRQYQLCYNLKCVALKSEDKKNLMLNEWSIRQAVFYHQFDIVSGNILWIVVQGNLELQQRFKALTDKNARTEDRSFGTTEECFRSSLSAHLMYCFWATEDWKEYIKWLERAADNESTMAVFGPSGFGHAHKTYSAQDIQDLQIWEEKARQVTIALEGNVDVMSALVAFYYNLIKDRNFPLRKTCAMEVTSFATQIRNIIVDFRMQIKRAEFLVRTISDRRELVIQHLQSQAASRSERLSRNMEQEQVFMLIITGVTLIYLPATFVSTFFSTDIIKYQESDSPGGKFSETAMVRWVQITIPLTVVTCVVAWLARRWMLSKRKEDHCGLTGHSGSWQMRQHFTSSVALLPMYK
ncbi:hypothetical protein F5B20DRAFT_52553 [Whalleya microplaca]|nr:hypothetical protein F5B20DRAFT_52553 [Whalleya microplaca]